MNVSELRALVASIPPEHDHRLVCLPEGFHSSEDPRWKLDEGDSDEPFERAVIITVRRCDGAHR